MFVKTKNNLYSSRHIVKLGIGLSLLNFILSASIGTLLRYNTISPLAWLVSRYWTHAHSHVGFLGWVFTALMVMGYDAFMTKDARLDKRMFYLLIAVQVAVLGMLITFPVTGYATWSIVFSTLHMGLSVVFVIWFFKCTDSQSLAVRFYRAALAFMLASGIGPLALGPIVLGGLKGTALYDMAIYYYLHFQYNGWFILAIFALLLSLLEKMHSPVSASRGRLLYRLMVLSVIMTFALSALGLTNSWYLKAIGLVGAVLQLWAGYLLLQMIFSIRDMSRMLVSPWVKWFFSVALFSWLLKIMLQFLSALPQITQFVYQSRDAIITYLHLVFLGVTTCFVFGLLIRKKILNVQHPLARVGLGLMVPAIVLMEITVGFRSLPQLITQSSYRIFNWSLLIESCVILGALVLISLFAMSFKSIDQKQK